jgi:hypothetical protein
MTVSSLFFTCLTCSLGVVVVLQIFLFVYEQGVIDLGLEWPAQAPTALAQVDAPYPTQTSYPTHTPYPPCPACADCPDTPTPVPATACATCPPTPTPTAVPLPTNTPKPQAPAPAPTATPAPTEEAPEPTATPESQYKFEVGQVDYLPPPHCDTNVFVSLQGLISDADGNPYGDYRLQAVNYSGLTVAPSPLSSYKPGYDIGFGDAWQHRTNIKYELPGGWDAGTWEIFVIDENGEQISPPFRWVLNPDCHNPAWVWFIPW